MKIAILGAGNGGCALAADLSLKGNDVTLIKTSNSIHDDNFNFLLQNKGKITFIDYAEEGNMNPKESTVEHIAYISNVTRDVSKVSEADVVIVFVQTPYHEPVIKMMAPYLRDGQILMFVPGYLAAALALKYIGDKDITIVEAQSSFIDGRIIEPGKFRVWFRNVRNPLGVYPRANTEMVKQKLESFGIPFVYLNHLIEASLHNPNMIVHTVGALMSIPQIENMKDSFCLYRYGFTEHVWNILESLDNEKMNVLEALGYQRLKYVDACKFRNSIDLSLDGKTIFFEYAAVFNCASGPFTVDSRYITEDVSQGLVMLESIGRHLGIMTTTASALIDIANAALHRDFRAEGRSIECLGIQNIDKVLNDK